MPRFESLQDWLSWQETLHPTEIELGLQRVADVYETLYSEKFYCPVVTVAGTNGKGSSVKMLESIYRAAGYKTASYTSPHLLSYNERIGINGSPVEDQLIVNAFQRIDDARGDISLTYFEFGTLAALDIFMQQRPDIVLLEVGLGGRLDAVNIIDSDVALITSIGIDHTDWLGSDRETIGREKAGIMRHSKPTVCSDPDIPRSIEQYANELGISLYRLTHEFSYFVNEDTWSWKCSDVVRDQLSVPALKGGHQYQNAAGVLTVIQLLVDQLPVTYQAICQGLQNSHLAGRFQALPGRPNWLWDVAHNTDSIAQLAQVLADSPVPGRTYALLGMLADKDIHSALRGIKGQIDSWHISQLSTPRSSTVEKLAEVLKSLDVEADQITAHSSFKPAWSELESLVTEDDRLVIFGSFYAVAEAMRLVDKVTEKVA